MTAVQWIWKLYLFKSKSNIYESAHKQHISDNRYNVAASMETTIPAHIIIPPTPTPFGFSPFYTGKACRTLTSSLWIVPMLRYDLLMTWPLSRSRPLFTVQPLSSFSINHAMSHTCTACVTYFNCKNDDDMYMYTQMYIHVPTCTCRCTWKLLTRDVDGGLMCASGYKSQDWTPTKIRIDVM